MANLFVWIRQQWREADSTHRLYVIIGTISLVLSLTAFVEMIEKLAGGQTTPWSVLIFHAPYEWIPPIEEHDFLLVLLVLSFSFTYMLAAGIMIFGGLWETLGFAVSWRYCEMGRHTYLISTAIYAFFYTNIRYLFIQPVSIIGVMAVLITICAEGCFGCCRNCTCCECCLPLIEEAEPENEFEEIFELPRPARPTRRQERVPREEVTLESIGTQTDPFSELSDYLESLNLPFIDEFGQDREVDTEIASASTSSQPLKSISSGLLTTVGSIQTETQSKSMEGEIELKDISCIEEITKDSEITTSFSKEAKHKRGSKKVEESSAPGSPTIITTLADIHVDPDELSTEHI